jgi:signal transduction histidine kinase/CheY-like chemotaxis protein
MDAVRAEAVRVMYSQTRMTVFAGVIITIYMVGVSVAFTPVRTVLVWAAFPLFLLAGRVVIARIFQSRARADSEMPRWAHGFVAQQVAVGAVWGATMLLFAHPEQPVSIALTLCCLYSLGAGSVTSLAYYPQANVGLITVLFGMIFARLAATGETRFILLGSASALFGVTMIGYCRNQSRAVLDSLRMRFENRELVEALGIEKREAEDARRRAEVANLAKSQFLAAASHDLRQPLHALSLFSASLGALRLDAEAQGVVGRIQGSIGVMGSLFDGLLDISKLDAGVVQARLQSVSVDALFDRLSQVFLPIAVARGLDLRFRSDNECVTSDPTLLEQLLSNLIANALRATSAGGVLVAARQASSAMSLEVWDTGRGIDTADRERIFDEFVQLDNPERDRNKGLGLGLSIARKAAALIGTPIEVRSRVGRGSRFCIAQPIARPPIDAPLTFPGARETVSVISRRADLPLLIVEDDRDIREALAQLLSRWGVAFETATTAAEAFARVAAGEHFGLLLTDYRLEGPMNGLDLIAALRHDYPALVPEAVLITGDFDPGLIGAAHRQRVPVLHKPLRPHDLATLLGRSDVR